MTKVAVSKERKSYLEVIIPGVFLLVNNIKVENHMFFYIDTLSCFGNDSIRYIHPFLAHSSEFNIRYHII